MRHGTPFPERLTLPELQRYVARIVAERQFTTDLDRVLILLVEELGELAAALAAHRALRNAESLHDLGSELADVTMYLADLANGLDVDVSVALGAKGGARIAERTLTEWQAAIGTSGSDTWGGLLVALGEAATVLRKRWVGLKDQDANRPLGQAFRGVLELASVSGVDLEQAVREKAKVNDTRTWTY